MGLGKVGFRGYASFVKPFMEISSFVKPFTEIPGPKSLPIFGSLLNYIPVFGEYSLDRLHHTGRLKYEKYGKIVREEIIPGTHYLFLFDPVDIEVLFRAEGRYPSRRSHTVLEKVRTVDTPNDHNSAGLLPTNGEEWSKMRLGFQQALSLEHIRRLVPQSDEVILDFVRRVNDPSMESSRTDFLPQLMNLSLELVGQNFFGVRIGNPLHDTSNTPPEVLVKAAEQVNEITVKTDQGLRLWRWIDTPLYRKIRRNILTLDKAAQFFVNYHMQRNKEQKPVSSNPSILEIWLREGDKDVKDIITMSADMILAGIDTTSYTLSFVLYHLATNGECQDKLYVELKTLLPSWDSPVTADVLSRATYLKRCLKESLRMNPVSLGVGRTIPEDTVIGGYQVPAKTVAVTMNQVACRFPENFDQPDEYLPDRWAPENKRTAKIHPYLLLPFGHGPRACIGRRLAEQQMQLIMARIFRRYKVEWRGTQKLDSFNVAINKPDAPLNFSFTQREE